MFNGCFDISHNNGAVKWSQVPATYPCVFIKATQGTRFVDPMFSRNVDGAHDTKRLVIPYHFINIEDPDIQAAHFVDTAKLTHGSCCMLDWEGSPHPPPLAILERMVASLRVTLSRDPIVYHGIYEMASATVNKCPWHIPKYGPMPKIEYKWLFWQDTSGAKIAGMPGNVDHDWFNGTEAELREFYASGTRPGGLVTPPPPKIFAGPVLPDSARIPKAIDPDSDAYADQLTKNNNA